MRTPAKPACRSQLEHAISEWIVLSLYADRDREIMRRRLIDGAPEGELAGEFHLSNERIKDIIEKWSAVVFEHIK